MIAVSEADELENKRKRLRFRSWHRGTRESDLLLGSFADLHVFAFDEGQLDRYDALIECNDPDIYDWMTGREPVPAEHDTDVMRLLRQHQYRPAQ